jgi:cytosine/adenosine deaminase-related metal-dependent hydrolase
MAHLISASHLLCGDPVRIERDHAVLVEDGRIADVGPRATLEGRHGAAERIDLDDHLLMPGLVNAHQHGLSVSHFQMGVRDDLLEPWLAALARIGPLDPHLSTHLAGLRMIANGVTATIQANTSFGFGDAKAELDGALRGYDESGIRAMVGVGVMDRAALVHPDEEQAKFLASLPGDLRDFAQSMVGGGYAGAAEEAMRLLHETKARLSGHPRLDVCYAPAGPEWVSDALFRAVAEDAERIGAAIHLHGLESHAQVITLQEIYPEGVLAHLDGLGLLSPRCSIAHGIWLAEDDLRRAAHTGVTIVRNPGSNLRLRAGLAPLASYVAAGVRVAIGTDSMALGDEDDLLSELRLAASIARSPRFDGPKPLTAEDAFAMATVNGARAMLREDLGRVMAGAAADLMALTLAPVRGVHLDPGIPLLDAVLTRGAGRHVSLTMVDGHLLYRDGKFLHADIDAVGRRVSGAIETARRSVAPWTKTLADRLAVEVARFHRKRETEAPASPPWSPLARPDGWC